MLQAHHEDRANRTGEQRDGDRRIGEVSGDCAKQRDYQEIAHPGARRAFGVWFPRAADEESDRQREQESKSG